MHLADGNGQKKAECSPDKSDIQSLSGCKSSKIFKSRRQFTEHSNFQYTIEHNRFLKFECLVSSWQKTRLQEDKIQDDKKKIQNKNYKIKNINLYGLPLTLIHCPFTLLFAFIALLYALCAMLSQL